MKIFNLNSSIEPKKYSLIHQAKTALFGINHIRMRHIASLFLLCLLATIMTACVGVSAQDRRANANALATAQHWQAARLTSDHFVLISYMPIALVKSEQLTVYIEGDGFAWLTRSQASDDPTPIKPVGLQLALRHNNGAVAYLARPCQYVNDKDAQGCTTSDWTNRRFSPEVIEATDQAVSQLKNTFGAKKLVLVGYSGGGAVAALVAAKRSDVTQLITVAGNLDHKTWTSLHKVPPLAGSLNPADAWQSLQKIPQLHFVGADDHNISAEVTQSYIARFPPENRPTMRVISGFDHACCWVEQWPELSLSIAH